MSVTARVCYLLETFKKSILLPLLFDPTGWLLTGVCNANGFWVLEVMVSEAKAEANNGKALFRRQLLRQRRKGNEEKECNLS